MTTTTKKAAALEATKTAALDLAEHYRELLFVTTYYSRSGYSTHGYKVWGVHSASGELHHLTFAVAEAAGLKTHRTGELRVGGCGYDKVHHVMSEAAYHAGRSLDAMPRYRHG